MIGISRRGFVRLLALGSVGLSSIAGVLSGCRKSPNPKAIAGSIVGASAAVGHLLREGLKAKPTKTERTKVAIVGGGVAGLSAARALRQAGISDFLIFELEREVGGNSTWGENSVTRYPWGAHYLPVPNRESVEVIELLEELEVIVGRDERGLPIYDEQYLCHAPEERLYLYGAWQESLIPQLGLEESDKRQFAEFFAQIEQLTASVGSDGKPAFAIPVDLSSADEQFRKLDQETFAAYLDRHGWTSNYLRWYTNYCCRDDYGTTEQEVSAWAGIHYFASRRAYAANAEGYELLTWPEGNGWIVRKLKAQFGETIRTQALVCRIEQLAALGSAVPLEPGAQDQNSAPIRLHVLAPATGEVTEVLADAVIYAAPRFTARHVVRDLPEQHLDCLKTMSYAPWMVANLTVRGYPRVGDLAWDNVSFHSDSLGYIVATHQQLGRVGNETVLTYYWPLSAAEPDVERAQALERSHAEWAKLVLDDLRRIDSELAKFVVGVDVWIWGHAMARPIPGQIWGAQREQMQQPFGRIYFANSDMGGCSIFEEAQMSGIRAAKALLAELEV